MKIIDKPIAVTNFPTQLRGKYKNNKSYIFTNENINLITNNPYKTYRLRRVEDILTEHEMYQERARCEGHIRYQVKKLRNDLGLDIKYKVISRFLYGSGFVEVYVTNLTNKTGETYAGGGGQ